MGEPFYKRLPKNNSLGNYAMLFDASAEIGLIPLEFREDLWCATTADLKVHVHAVLIS